MIRGSAASRICPNVWLFTVTMGACNGVLSLAGRNQLNTLNASTRASNV